MTEFFNGKIEDAKFHDHPLSAAEILREYNRYRVWYRRLFRWFKMCVEKVKK